MSNHVCHWDLTVSDMEKAKAFYGQVFDWKFDETSMPGYTMIDTGKEPGGGMMVRPPQAPHCSLSTYFLVDDVEATLAKAVAAGAKVIVPRTPIPGVGAFGMFLDPDGIPLGVFESLPEQGC